MLSDNNKNNAKIYTFEAKETYQLPRLVAKLIELDNCDNDGIKIEDIYFVFQEWFKEANGQGNKCPSRKDLTSNLNKRYGCKSSNKKMWKGIGFKDKDDEIFMDD